MTTFYLTTFRALAHNAHGRRAIKAFGSPPFIDASCRREPDLESKFPSITALCRGGNFAPRLKEGDVVAYMTKAIAYPCGTERCRRLVAVLRVYKSWLAGIDETGRQVHERAAAWYRSKGLSIPSNCIVRGNDPLPLEQTDLHQKNLRKWDAKYWKRARRFGVFHACEPLFKELQNPPRLTDDQLRKWFGKLPGTQNPGALPAEDFAKLVRWLASMVEGPRESATHLARRLHEVANRLD